MNFTNPNVWFFRDNSLNRSERLSTAGMIESVAEMRNKYSPANYVPAIYRNKYENISRSKSINDIGKSNDNTI